MKTKLSKTSYVILLSLFIISLAGCIKGDMGPQGLKGDTGAQGAQGAQGPAGNANVSSLTFNVSSSDWVVNYSDNFYTLYVTLAATNITSDIANSGMVEVFMYNTDGFWYDLPLTFGNSNGPVLMYNYNYEAGTVTVLKFYADGSSEPVATKTSFKVVAIASSSVVSSTKINWKNYREIADKFKLNN